MKNDKLGAATENIIYEAGVRDMKIVTLRKLMCYFITIVMLFLGICFYDIDDFGNIEVDSSFAYTESGKNIPTLNSCGKILSEGVMCTDEQLSARGAGSRLEESSRVNERAVRKMKFLSLAEILPEHSVLKFIMTSAEKGRENRASTVIICYVHNQDGAKSR